MKAGKKFRFGRLRLEQPIAQTFQIPALRKEREGRGTPQWWWMCRRGQEPKFPPFAKNAKNGAPLCIGNAGEIKNLGCCHERATGARPTIPRPNP
jgi:hypothetical protein